MRSLADRVRSFEQQKARLADAEAKLKLAEKKARNRHLIEIGTLVEKAGLSELTVETLMGALLSLDDGAKNAAQKKTWANAGTAALADNTDADNSEPIVLTFQAPLDKEAMVRLRTIGFRFNKVLQHWEGMAVFEDANKVTAELGGKLKRISPPAETPTVNQA